MRPSVMHGEGGSRQGVSRTRAKRRERTAKSRMHGWHGSHRSDIVADMRTVAYVFALCLVVVLRIRVSFISMSRKRWSILTACLCAAVLLGVVRERNYAIVCWIGVVVTIVVMIVAWLGREDDIGPEVAVEPDGVVRGSASLLGGSRSTGGTLELRGRYLRFLDVHDVVVFELQVGEIQNLRFTGPGARRRGHLQFDAEARHYRLNFNEAASSTRFSYFRSIQIWREAITEQMAGAEASA